MNEELDEVRWYFVTRDSELFVEDICSYEERGKIERKKRGFFYFIWCASKDESEN